jgi:hypothetical protein
MTAGSASIVNLVIEKGTDFESSFFLTGDDGGPLNLLYSNAIAILKKHPSSPKEYPFKVGITTADSEVNISMGRTMTSTLPSGRNQFDIFIENTELDFVVRVITGTVIVEDTTR